MVIFIYLFKVNKTKKRLKIKVGKKINSKITLTLNIQSDPDIIE